MATTGALAAALLVAGAGTASATAPQDRPLATWNMQNGRTQGQWDRVERLARYNDVVALQEVPSRLPRRRRGHNGQERLRQLSRVPSQGITVWRWETGRAGVRYLTVLDQRPGERFTTASRLAMVTTWNPVRNVVRMDHQPRAMLGIINRHDGPGGTLYADFHAAANGGRRNDAAGLLWHIHNDARTAHLGNWIALGDTNRDPVDLERDGLPDDAIIYNTGQPTHLNREEYDYLIANVRTQNWQASREPLRGADHNPIVFTALIPEEQDHAAWARISADNSKISKPHNVGVSEQHTENGTHVIGWQPTTNDGQQWNFVAISTDRHGHTIFRIISHLHYTNPHDELRRSLREDKCLDVHNGQHSRAGNFLNIWTCHGPDGQPLSGGKQGDTQNWLVLHPDERFPDETVLLNNASNNGWDNKYAYMAGNYNGAWLIQQWWMPGNPRSREPWADDPVSNEIFHLHPVVPDA